MPGLRDDIEVCLTGMSKRKFGMVSKLCKRESGQYSKRCGRDEGAGCCPRQGQKVELRQIAKPVRGYANEADDKHTEDKDGDYWGK